MSYVFHIPSRATNYMDLKRLITKIWGRNCRILHSTHTTFAYAEGWNCVAEGKPDSKFTLLCLQLPATVTHEDIVEHSQ